MKVPQFRCFQQAARAWLLGTRSRKRKSRANTGAGAPVSQPARHRPEGTAKAAEKLVAAIPEMTPDRLVRLWMNANRILSSQGRAAEHGAALHVIEAVEAAWDALELAEGELFPWPSTEVGASIGSSAVAGFRSEGMLSYLEYRVGKTAGLPANVRQSILARAFEGKLPRVFEPAYMNEWGQPRSAQRLRKMAESLAAFARNFKRLDEDRYDEAIRQWEQDLDFLYFRYYVGRFGFGWPSTAINGVAVLPQRRM